jgi:hypothetical protein
MPCQLGGRARLADAGLADQRHQAALPARRGLQRRTQRGHLARATDKARAGGSYTRCRGFEHRF